MAEKIDVADQVLLLLSLVPYLEAHGPTPIDELAETFNVSAAVLRRLLNFLGTAGVPGETLTYQHEDLFDIDWDALEHHDIAHLIRPIAVDDVPRFAPAETAALVAGLHALTTMLPHDDAEVARHTAKKLGDALGLSHDAVTLSVSAEPHDARLPVLIQALREHRQLSFVYRDVQGVESRRQVDPLQLTEGTGTWYLRAYCYTRAGERTFRMDRIADLTLSQQSVGDRADLTVSPEAVPNRATPMSVVSHDTPPVVTLQVMLRDWVLSRVSGFDPAPVPDSSSSDLVAPPEGWQRVTIEVSYIATAIALVQHAPGALIIEAPVEAQAAVRAWAGQAHAQYEL